MARNRSSRLAGALLGQERVLAHDKTLAGKLGSGDLGEIALVEQRELQGTGVEQGADLWGPERGDPVEARRASARRGCGRW